MISKAYGATVTGIDAQPILVEVDASRGLPNETLVGLPDTVVKESKNRIKSAIKNAGFEYPLKNYVINLAPAELRKEGPLLDLAIAVALLQATEQISTIKNSLFVGELSLDGSLNPIRGIIAICEAAEKLSPDMTVYAPYDNFIESTAFGLLNCQPIQTLKELIDISTGTYHPHPAPKSQTQPSKKHTRDFSEVKGQLAAKRVLEIAAAGNHNVLLIGPPGSGKSMLIQRLPSILPPLDHKERVETHKILSLVAPPSILKKGPMLQRPLRAPHHSISYAGMAGGGTFPKPGEISLAHHGVLFLDELPEFQRRVLELLRQPLEEKKIHISRANFSVEYPANFMFISAMNPCPCGFRGDSKTQCSCSELQVKNYWKKISGPILDRIDIVIEVPRLKKEEYFSKKDPKENPYTSEKMYQRVVQAREFQSQRYKKSLTNSLLSPKDIEKYCQLCPDSKKILELAIDEGFLSARAFHRVLKVARTLADLDQSDSIRLTDITEAIQLRKTSQFI